MARYANIDEVLHNVPVDDMGNVDFITLEKVLMKSTADVVPKSEVEKEIKNWQELYADTVRKWEKAYEELEIKFENAKAEVAKTFRQRMNEKMGKHTHLLGKEYVQRIMREVEKELTGEKDA